MSTFFINGKPTDFDGLRKLRNPPSSIIILLIVPIKKIPLFSEDLITFIIYFISLFFSVFHLERNESLFLFIYSFIHSFIHLFILRKILSPASTKMFLLFFNSEKNSFISFGVECIIPSGSILSKPTNLSICTILES